jgi:hypothetical protein
MTFRKNFQRESAGFLFVSVGLFGFLHGVSGSVYSCFVVRFNIVCGANLHGLWCALAMLGCVEERFQKKKNEAIA